MKPTGAVFDKIWRAKCVVTPIAKCDVDHMIKWHYIGKWPGVCTLILALVMEEHAVGVIVFALPPRETAKRYGGVAWELARLWLMDDVPQNAETFLISRAVRYIKRYHKEVCALVSYADPSVGHSGVIYKAANWTADGRTDQERKMPRFDYADAATGKHYSRRGHVPNNVTIVRVPRVSKWRFVLQLC